MSRLGTHQQRKVSKRAFPTADGLLVLYACRNPRLILQVLHRHLKLTTFLQESARLRVEEQELRARLKQLQQRNRGRLSRIGGLESDLARERETLAAREIVQTQQLSLAKVHSALSGYTATQESVPYQVEIRLGVDLQRRRDTLTRLKTRKLHASQLYLAERTRSLEPSRAFAETTRFEAPNGDNCALRFDVVPFEGVASVKRVFDALTFYYTNLEIRVTEVLGDVTLREDDGGGDTSILHGRVVSYLPTGTPLEMNSVVFMHYSDRETEYGGCGRPFGIIASEFFDEDELYPYVPAERIRQDSTTAITVTLQTRTTLNETGGAVKEDVVVMTCSCFLKLHKTNLKLSPAAAWGLRDNLGKWGDIMLNTVRELVYQSASTGTDS